MHLKMSEARQLHRDAARAGRLALLWEEDEEEETSPFWWEFIDSGLCTTMIFFIAMLLCLWCIPLGSGNADEVALSYRVTVWYSVLFVVESAIDVAWGTYRWVLELRIEQDRRLLDTLSELFPTSYRAPWLDKLHWDVWAAVGFLIGSLFYLAAAYFDEGATWAWMDVVRYCGLSDDEISSVCDQAGAWIFFFDSLICIAGRWSYRRTIAPKDRLILVQVWRLRGFFQLDWAAWGDGFYVVGAIASIFAQYNPDSNFLNWASELLWTFDSISYLFACLPCFIAANAARGLTYGSSYA